MNDLTNVRQVTAAVSDREGQLSLFGGPDCASGGTTTIAHRGVGLREQGRLHRPVHW
jgi:hypothetical protein